MSRHAVPCHARKTGMKKREEEEEEKRSSSRKKANYSTGRRIRRAQAAGQIRT